MGKHVRRTIHLLQIRQGVMKVEKQMEKLGELDGLRALMAFIVFVSHVQFLVGREIDALPIGGYAVTVFVMLSGFAITRSLMASTATYGQYMARRFFRIYPVYMIGLVLGLCTSWFIPDLVNALGWVRGEAVVRLTARGISEDQHFVAHLLAHLSLIHGAIPDNVLYGAGLAFNGPAWSLSLEWQFYLLAPLLLAGFAGANKLHWLVPLVLAAAAFYVLRKVGIALSPIYPQIPSFLPQQLIFFFVGIWSAHFYDRISSSKLYAAAFLMAVAVMGWKMGGLLNLASTITWVFIIALGSALRNRLFTQVRDILGSKAMSSAGEASYGFYIIHMPVILTVAMIAKRLAPDVSQDALSAILYSTAVPIGTFAWLSFTRLESPINRWAKRRFKGDGRSASRPSPSQINPA